MDDLDVSHSDTVVFHLRGATLLSDLSDLRWHLDDLLAGREPVIVVDISDLALLSSATLAALLWTQRRCRARGGRVVLRGPNRRCQTLLTGTGLAGMFVIEAQAPKLRKRGPSAGKASL